MTADTLASLLLARSEDDRPGLMFEDAVWSWREHVAACRAAGAWLSGQGAGPHVGVLGDNVPGLVFLVGAAALGGSVIVALNPTRPADELIRDARATDVNFLLADTPYVEAARTVAEALGIATVPLSAVPQVGAPGPPGGGRAHDGARRTGGGQPPDESPGASRAAPADGAEPAEPAEPADRAEPAEPVELADRAEPGDLVMLLFTSGTSGRPRAVRITQRKLAVPGTSLAALLTPGDVVYCSMPLFHSGALMAAYAPAVASGAALALRRRFSASGLLPDIRRYGGTYLHYVGKALSYVLATPERPDDADNPLKIACGNEGSAVAIRRFGERFGCRVIDAFGSTETAIPFSPDPAGPPGCLGRLPGNVKILDPSTGRPCPPGRIEEGRLLNPDEAVGELVNTAGLGLFEGYYNDPEADAERVRDGAYWSGDLAYTDADGYVFFAGRGTEGLRVDGENLAVAPVEAALREFGGVVEAAVGRPTRSSSASSPARPGAPPTRSGSAPPTGSGR